MTPPPPPSEKRWLPEESLPAETAATLARSRDFRARFAKATGADALRLAMQAPALLESLEIVVARVAAELPTGDLARRRAPAPRPKSLSPEVIALVEDVARRFLRENSVVIEEADIVGGGGK